MKEKFPFFHHHPKIVYFDNAATTLKPYTVINATTDYYQRSGLTAHRSLYTDSSDHIDRVRHLVKSHIINGKYPNDGEVIFTSGATESLNLLARGLCRERENGRTLLGPMEHNSSIAPFFNIHSHVKLCRSYDQLIESIKYSEDIIVVTHTSNVTGEEAPLKDIYARSLRVGAKVVVDASQAMIYTVPEYFDYLVFSGHKIYGPTGIGVIFGGYLRSSKFGSSMSYFNGTRMQETDDIVEAGTPNIAGIIGLGEAIKFLDDSSVFDKCKKDFLSLFVYLKEEVERLGIVHIGSNHILSLFVVDPYALEEHLRSEGIYVRVGRHCADFAFDNLNIQDDPKWKGRLFDHRASVRISLACYNNMADVIRLVEALRNYLKGVDQ